MLRTSLCAVALLAAIPTTLPQSSTQVSTSRTQREQPTPWAFHGPFESLTHAIVVAPAPRLFVAYDADTCGYRGAWTGSIALIDSDSGLPGAQRKGAWQSEGLEGSAWEIRKKGEIVPSVARYQGCTFDAGLVRLQFDISLQGSEPSVVQIEETPTVMTQAELNELWPGEGEWPSEPGIVWLKRGFVARGLPPGLELSLRYARTVAGVTGSDGIDLRRDPRLGEFTTSNGILVEPIICTFESGLVGKLFEAIELK